MRHRPRSRPDLAPILAGLVALAFLALACGHTPPDLTPEAQVAFSATRVVKVLDVVRDAAIAANETMPPIIKTADTRTVVLWHKTSVQVIAATPGGWKPTVLESLYRLTCHPQAGSGPCTPQLPPEAVTRLYPYVGLALVVIGEVQ
jgi:hypothetical protein